MCIVLTVPFCSNTVARGLDQISQGVQHSMFSLPFTTICQQCDWGFVPITDQFSNYSWKPIRVNEVLKHIYYNKIYVIFIYILLFFYCYAGMRYELL